MGLSDFPNGATSFGNVVGAQYGWGIGNVYYVCQAANSVVYNNMRLKYGGEIYDNDHSIMLHTTIQSALDATVANRDDYVIICGDATQYASTTTLTMEKQGVHLLSPSGMGTPYGSGQRAAGITATGDVAAVTTSARNVEIAGLFIKGYKANVAVIAIGTDGYSNIHNNFVGISAGAEGTAGGIMCAAASYSNNSDIHHNYVTNFNPTLMTGADNTGVACIGLLSASGTRNMIHNNVIVAGANTVWATGIKDVGTGIMVFDNLMHESITPGAGVQAGTFTLGISTQTDAFVARNLITMATHAGGVDGGTANQSYIENYAGTAGGGTVLV